MGLKESRIHWRVHVTVGYRWLPLATVGYRDEPNGQQGSRHCDWSPVVVSIGVDWCRLVTFGDVGTTIGVVRCRSLAKLGVRFDAA
jgi:hypothetical protein